jgi:hypothetical protein
MRGNRKVDNWIEKLVGMMRNGNIGKKVEEGLKIIMDNKQH